MAKTPSAQRAQDGVKSAAASDADIAATLLTPVAAAAVELVKPAKAAAPTSGDSDDDFDLSVLDDMNDPDDPDAQDDQDEGQQEDDHSGNTDDDQDEDADDNGDQDEDPDFFDISDDDLITVVVDGEEKEVSIGALKKAHSLGGATEKRLQEATETRKAAHAERTQMLERLAAQERDITEALSNLDDSVYAAVIPAPPEGLKATNPAQYLRHKEAYDADQARINAAKSVVQTRLQDIQSKRKERLAEYSQAAGQIILQEIPELRDQKTAAPMVKRLGDTAKQYGYTDAEISNALDPRMFLLVRDAMKYRDIMARSKERVDPTNLAGQVQKKVRRLRSGVTQAKNRALTTDKQQKAAVAKARQSGAVADIAATILAPRKKG